MTRAIPHSANDIQHGGDHYKKRDYEHWDFVCDIKLHYLVACASKYVSRWRDKNGVEDLHKADHYLMKAQERGIEPTGLSALDPIGLRASAVDRFTAQLGPMERAAIMEMTSGDYEAARRTIQNLAGDA